MAASGSRVSSVVSFFNGLGQRNSDSYAIEMTSDPAGGSGQRGTVGANGQPGVDHSDGVNEAVAAPVVINTKQEMKRYHAFSIALFAGILTMSVFALSATKLDDDVKSAITICFILMFLLSALAITCTIVKDNGTEDDVVAAATVQEGILGCKPGASISVVSVSLLCQLVYIVDISFLILHSYLHRGRIILLVVGIPTDIVIVLVWINIWKRPQCAYFWCVMASIRKHSWTVVSWLFTKLGFAPAEVRVARRDQAV